MTEITILWYSRDRRGCWQQTIQNMFLSIALDPWSVKKNVHHLRLLSKRNPKHRKNRSFECFSASISNVSKDGLRFKIRTIPPVHINIIVSFIFFGSVMMWSSEHSRRPNAILGIRQTILRRRSHSIATAFHQFTGSILTKSSFILSHFEQKYPQSWQVLWILLWNLSRTLSRRCFLSLSTTIWIL